MNASLAALCAVIAVSVAGGWYFTARRIAEKPVKVMLFVAYFWLTAFIQLTLIAAAYFVWTHF
jgi:hypothetical protein